ncbi:hypothetical protein RhiirA5_454535 [Rhizophagus irregularis]|uniref:Crinkler effector protein N-terminal domain-containing protein n=1 Tax=Rhizophagus irregularis TaxID=588596 RepID=A0A2I1EYJ0_9GLOM|nr:hypothetical protein RhiirA5_454535 [Rhizophagus irregularis]PKC69715.1 hypothetical protein RhiirA1_503737 [Rhizophagus irregularis]PKY27168.1 hypothetical protein RhiirB3_390090 [Rhizophagus irregularis]GET53827.1 hypothetical protein GLOIN_2v1672739 [Rhizophagus irregularis DAOM 181602=DAOM 197198]
MYLLPKCADKLKYSVFWESMDELSLKKFLDFRLKANDLKDRDIEHRQYNRKSLKITMNELENQMCLEQTKYILDATRKTVDQGLFLQKSIVKRFENRVLHACCMSDLVEGSADKKLLKTLKPERENAQLRKLQPFMCFCQHRKMRSVDINCLVLGKPFRNIISIKIKENETIGELKRRIKAEKDYFGSCPLDQ